jgi:Cu-processing system permease protein
MSRGGRSWTRGVFWTCARQELALAVRSRWMQTFAVVFALLALAVASAGYVLSGGTGFQDFARTSASLVDLVVLLVPLTALLFGVNVLTPEPGAVEMLFSQPVARGTILAGQLAGLLLALTGAEGIGFGVAGLVLFTRTGSDGLTSFLGVAAGTVVLTAVFIGLAALVAAGSTSVTRTRSLAVALVVWFVAVVLYDVAMLGAASALPSGVASRLLMVGVVANPVDAVRTGTLLGVEGTTAFGAASLAFFRFTGGGWGAAGWLTASLVGWLVAPLMAAGARLNRADL